MKKNTKQGFTVAEILLTLGLIGIMCSTTLAVNNIDTFDCKVAETKVIQTNEALNAWSKDFLKNGESGVGIAYNFTDEDALINSLRKYVNIKDIQNSESEEVFLNIEGYNYKNYKKITLNNGTFINVKYVYRGPSNITFNNQVYQSTRFSSYYAYLTVNVPYKNKTKITNVYLLKYNELKDIGYIDNVCEI